MASDPPEGWEGDNGHPKDIVCMLNVVVQILCITLILPVVITRIFVRRRIQDVMHLEDCRSSVIPRSTKPNSNDISRVLHMCYGT